MPMMPLPYRASSPLGSRSSGSRCPGSLHENGSPMTPTDETPNVELQENIDALRAELTRLGELIDELAAAVRDQNPTS